MDNEGAPQPNLDPNVDGVGAADENVDQYFDDGGETFLPADHVSRITLSYAWPLKQDVLAASPYEI